MFKKITSNRSPDATIWKELHGEFGHYYRGLRPAGEHIIRSHPRICFAAMVLMLLTSGTLTLILFRNQLNETPFGHRTYDHREQHSKSRQPLDDGFSRILVTGSALRQTLAMKKKAEAILAKGRLSHTDSVSLENTLDSLRQLQHQLH